MILIKKDNVVLNEGQEIFSAVWRLILLLRAHRGRGNPGLRGGCFAALAMRTVPLLLVMEEGEADVL